MSWTPWTMPWSRVLLCLYVSAFLVDGVRTVHSRHNRAGRHRRVPDPGPDPVVQVFGEVQEQQQNKHKPVFENCENYQPEVNEEASRGRNLFILFSLNYFRRQIAFLLLSIASRWIICRFIVLVDGRLFIM